LGYSIKGLYQQEFNDKDSYKSCNFAIRTSLCKNSIEPDKKMNIFTDDYFMKMALKEAKIAFEESEVPVGAVITIGNKIIAKGHNMTERLTDVTAHAEMQCITAASTYLGGKYLKGCTLYVTLEPCVMCAGAIYWSQIDRLVYGARDEKRGYTTHQLSLHPKTEVCSGVLSTECSRLIIDFFKNKRLIS